jgi:hypothetical protein
MGSWYLRWLLFLHWLLVPVDLRKKQRRLRRPPPPPPPLQQRQGEARPPLRLLRLLRLLRQRQLLLQRLQQQLQR